MRTVDRANYVLDKQHAYEDSPQCVALTQAHRSRISPSCNCKDRSATTRPSLLHTWHVSLLSSRLNSKLQPTTFHTRNTHTHIAKQHAHAAELLLPYLRDRPAARVLDVGAGSGYFSSVCYHLVRGVQQGGTGGGSTRTSTVVVGIEHIPALTALAEQNIRADGLGGALDEQAIVLVTGDGRLGVSIYSPS